jgi:hypothetical protein
MLALGLIAAGRLDEAVTLLERAEPQGALLWISVQFPAFEPLRRLDRFQRLIDAIRPPGAR